MEAPLRNNEINITWISEACQYECENGFSRDKYS